ncbi:hypothetical protein E3E22_09160 [Thermococcus sp. MV5]|uniref:hypothetical protein n=1 Tax=Thermococcus sp. MV5 TaxID=1638272 RepID=UPI00143BFD07|nr:hypothetical protein [Thermococcus sp. MV5]NJE26776.1 hypothetical protein [Thermococcus sp. MV5]
MKIEIPYLVVDINGKLFMMDAYFSKKVEKIEHVSVLIKKFDRSLRKDPRTPLPNLIDEENVEYFIKDVFKKVYHRSGKKLDERLRHIRKWNLFRLFGIPSGFKRHKEKDEELARENRESLLALALLQKVLGIKNPQELENVEIKAIEWRYYTIEIKKDGIYNEKGKKDPIYTELMERDNGFAASIHAFEYNQQAT